MSAINLVNDKNLARELLLASILAGVNPTDIRVEEVRPFEDFWHVTVMAGGNAFGGASYAVEKVTGRVHTLSARVPTRTALASLITV